MARESVVINALFHAQMIQLPFVCQRRCRLNEANPTKLFVWATIVQTGCSIYTPSLDEIKNQLESLWTYAQKIYNAEFQMPKTSDITETSAKKIKILSKQKTTH